jgi:tetratricopeptide (TPR) repeat protein
MAQAVHVGAPYAENTAWCVAELAKLMLADSMVMPAEKIVAKELKSSPNSVALLTVMGRIKATQKNYPAAIEFYKKAAAIVPQHDTLVALGDLYHLSRNAIEAEKQFQLVETIHKINKANGVKGDLQIARFYADHDRNLPEALRLADEEYKTRRSVYGADTLAWCLYKNGKVAEADKMIREAIRLKTEEARFYYHAGVIFAKMQYRETAKQMLAQALAINSHFDPVEAPNAQKQLREVGGIATLASYPRASHSEESGQQ